MINTISFKLGHLSFISKKQLGKHLQTKFTNKCLQKDVMYIAVINSKALIYGVGVFYKYYKLLRREKKAYCGGQKAIFLFNISALTLFCVALGANSFLYLSSMLDCPAQLDHASSQSCGPKASMSSPNIISASLLN